MEISQNFVAFLEYMNFNITFQIKHKVEIWLHWTDLNRPQSHSKVLIYSEKALRSEKISQFYFKLPTYAILGVYELYDCCGILG